MNYIVGKSGQISLGKNFAGKALRVEHRRDGAIELKQVVASLCRLGELDWAETYRHTGYQWEAIEHLRAPHAASVYSLRLSQKVRTLVVITHDLALARRAGRIVEIHDGKIVRDGPAAEAA